MMRVLLATCVACSGSPAPPPSNVAPPADPGAAKYVCLRDNCITDKDMCEMWRGNAAMIEPDQPPCVPVAVVYCHGDDCYRTRSACEHDYRRCVERH